MTCMATLRNGVRIGMRKPITVKAPPLIHAVPVRERAGCFVVAVGTSPERCAVQRFAAAVPRRTGVSSTSASAWLGHRSNTMRYLVAKPRWNETTLNQERLIKNCWPSERAGDLSFQRPRRRPLRHAGRAVASHRSFRGRRALGLIDAMSRTA